VSRNIPHVQAGVQTNAPTWKPASGRGAVAVLGWPIDDAAPARPGTSRAAQPELSAIVELINRVDKESASTGWKRC
jgi:EAL and modified HD-GYP domain-containing signal transduction protein